MHKYHCRFTWKGHTYEDDVLADSSISAERLIRARYPGITALVIKKIN